MKEDFNIELANRFISDYKLPIPKFFNIGQFAHYLFLCEKDYKALTKYKNLINLIDERFEGDSDIFLKEYYDKREEIIQTILANTAYQEFNNMDMNCFAIKDAPKNITSKNIYNCENVNKIFFSIDLKKANFQALKYVNPEIVFNKETYEDFIGMFTDLDYIKESKYTRQVIFGKCNPKRHITVEKFIINEIRKFIGDKLFKNINMNLVSFSNDEIIYECFSHTDLFDEEIISNIKCIIDNLKIDIKNFIGVEVSASMFKLKGYNLYNLINNKVCKTFFIKEDWLNNKKEFKCVPEPLFAIIYKLYNKKEILSADRVINYDGLKAELTDDFYIKEI
mgnify:CR=1 FL=1